MKILQIAPIALPIRADMGYGGIERVIYLLDKEFSRLGHKSIVAGVGNSDIKGTLYPTFDRNLWNKYGDTNRNLGRYLDYHFGKVIDFIKDGGIDVVHDQTGTFVFSEPYKKFNRELKVPILTTLHNPAEVEQLGKEGNSFKDEKLFFNSISHSQRNTFLHASIDEVVYNAIDTKEYPFDKEKEDYLFSLGRICYDKGQHIAIEVSKKTGVPLIIGGNVHKVHEDYYENEIKPKIDGKQIRYVGELNDESKKKFYRKAKAFLMPIYGEECFGLVMIEAMACGTPVVAFDRGAVPEVVEHNKTGFVVEKDNLEEMVNSIKKIGNINPYDCRKHVEDKFDIEIQTENYIALYNKVIKEYDRRISPSLMEMSI